MMGNYHVRFFGGKGKKFPYLASKLVFGDESNKAILINFLSKVLRMPESNFEGIEFINTELPKEFEEDKKGILDVRVKTSDGKHVDVEIQLAKSKYMPERTMFYWSKMYTSQIKSGDFYKKLKKCITINIIDYEFIPLEKIHTKYHLFEDDTRHKLTDVLEIHFLELPKLKEYKRLKDLDDPIIDWMEFLNADTEGVMEVLAKKNENIEKAYMILKAASQDEKKRLAYEARQAAIMDEMSRIDEAKDEAKEEGKLEVAVEMLKRGFDFEMISQITKMPVDELKEKTKEL
jgi:predicted transposase/invertase (TIGR01784 family)